MNENDLRGRSSLRARPARNNPLRYSAWRGGRLVRLTVRELITALNEALSGDNLRQLLIAYVATGDHDHGNGPIYGNGPCPGGDCIVSRAKTQLRLIDPDFSGTGAEYFLDGWRMWRESDPIVRAGLAGDRLSGYASCAIAQSRSESLDDDNALRTWTRVK